MSCYSQLGAHGNSKDEHRIPFCSCSMNARTRALQYIPCANLYMSGREVTVANSQRLTFDAAFVSLGEILNTGYGFGRTLHTGILNLWVRASTGAQGVPDRRTPYPKPRQNHVSQRENFILLFSFLIWSL